MNSKNKIFISTIAFISMFVTAMFNSGTAAQEPYGLHRVNTEIIRTRNSIDSVRNAHATAMTRQLRKNANYRYISENASDIDTLRQRNEELMTMAIYEIHRKHPTIFVPRTTVMFIQYSNIFAVSTIASMYNHNKYRIQEYERRVAAFEPEYLMIKNRCDSAMYSQIDMYQMRMDSLLNIKAQLLR